ncbi:hypothetical protein EDD11_001666 [Mortierella claussenii]|nr:hypothetical protein EDD11_001666 [Mortierella claussenii]
MNNFPRGNAPTPARRAAPRMTLSQMGGGAPAQKQETPFSNFSRFVDPSGKLNFNGKAILHADGVDFSNGNSFKINMEELSLLEELGKGQYGTVQKVFHKPTNVTMAMKEIRLELDQSKLNSILMELDVLHKSQNPYIVEFYGAFFIETCVYYCMEFMDAGSLDKLYQIGVPEDILSNITLSMVKGLKFLKDELSIIHRDVKPTNVLVNSQGQVKLCDFGVSGHLIQSMAKTHIGCQSYMAPERISQGQTYTVQSDVWSLGLSILETAAGSYPYSPDTYSSVFEQLTAIVHNPPPALPNGYSDDARSFVALCLLKDAKERPTYAALLKHTFLTKYEEAEVDMKGWAVKAMAARIAREEEAKAGNPAPPA